MIIVTVTAKIHPDRREEAQRVALWMAEETRKEEGCLRYAFYSPLDDPNTVFVYEEWASDEALNGHIQSEHMKVFQEQIPAFLAGAPEVKRYTCS